MATSKSTDPEPVDRVPVLPPGHLNDVGQMAVREPVPSCVKNQLMVWPSLALLKTGAAVMLAVIVTVNTFEAEQSTARDEAAKVSEDGLVWAAPATVMTPDENRLSTELEPAVNLPTAALVALRPVMLALVAVSVVANRLVTVPLATLAVVKLALPPENVVARKEVTLAVVMLALP